MADITPNNQSGASNPKTRIYRTFDRKTRSNDDSDNQIKKVRFDNTNRFARTHTNPKYRTNDPRAQFSRTAPKDPSHTNPGSDTAGAHREHRQQPRRPSGPLRPSSHSRQPLRPDNAPGIVNNRRFNGPRKSAPRARSTAPDHEIFPVTASLVNVPPIEPGVVRVIPICGVEWITTNMTAIEYGDEIVIIDDGFGFKNPDTPGIQCTIPDVTYLEQNKHKIKAMVITHGHLDHIGAIPYTIERLGMPPIYSREFGALLIQKRMEEFPHVPKLDMHIVSKEAGYITLSENFKVKFFGLTHSIPDSTGVIIQTPFGGIVSTGDVRVENVDGVPVPEEFENYGHFKDEKILLATIDSTGIPKPGWSDSEQLVRDNIDKLIGSASGRLFIAAYSSQVERLLSFLESARKHNRKVVIDGRSMKSNLEIAKFLELGNFDHVIPMEDADNYPPNKLLYLVTGGQGEKYSVLDRVRKDEHRFIKLGIGDTLILSSSVVPGNDYSVDQLKNGLYASGATILTYTDNVVHSSGHGKREELRWIHTQIPYKFFMPVHGGPWFLHVHAQMAEELGTPHENIVIPQNGSIVEIYDSGEKIRVRKELAVGPTQIVDGAYVGPLHPVVMEDRLTLAENGMFVVVVTIDARSRRLVKTPDIVSRGFVYLRESRELISRSRVVIKKTCEAYLHEAREIDADQLKKHLADKVYKYLLTKTLKEPIVIPVVVII